MSHTPTHNPEAAVESQQRTAQPGDSALQQQTAQLLASPEGAEVQASQQASKLAVQGLKDLGGQNEVTGILELMKASQLKPDIVRDQGFFSNLRTVVGDIQAPHSEDQHFVQIVPAAQDVQAPQENQQQAQAASDSSGQSRAIADTSATAGGDQSMQLIQRGLSAIASGDKLTGIVALMQAAQANPNIISDARFQAALQTALSQGAAAKGGAVSAEAQVSQPLTKTITTASATEATSG